MEISVAQGGKFTFTVKAKELAQGLRPAKQNPRDNDFLIVCAGAVGKDGALQVLNNLTRVVTSVITDDFPFPQIFTLTNLTIVCGLKNIYEWDGTTLSLKYTTSEDDTGGVWSVVDFYDYVYMSNGKIAIVRIASDYSYAVSDLPSASAICNYNGQVIIGAPNMDTALGLGV